MLLFIIGLNKLIKDEHPDSAYNLNVPILLYSSIKTDAGRDWGQEEKGTTEDEMAGWHHRLDGREFQ